VYTRDMDDSVFTKIIKGEIPGEMVYQDEECVVLLTIEPFTPGHCLVVSRAQIDHLWDADDELYQHLMGVTKKVANAMREVYGYPRVGQIVEGFGVPHAHIHLFGLVQPIESTIAEHEATKRMATAEELHAEADKLRSALV
jgi:histidine triad (HIT) family protein